MTSRSCKNHSLASELGLRGSVCACVEMPLAAMRTRSAAHLAVPRAMHANNGFVWH